MSTAAAKVMDQPPLRISRDAPPDTSHILLAVGFSDQFCIVAVKPAFGIALLERPAHDGYAFLDHRSIAEIEHWVRRLGACSDQFGWLVGKLYFAK